VHRLREAGRVIAGHSLGSLLVLHALFQDKPFFDRALASAPSIWWDNRSILGLVAKLHERRAKLAGRLYIGVGEKDTPSMLGDIILLENLLERHPFSGLMVKSEQFPGQDHYDVMPFTMESGLVSLLG
jgi:predicted alpha/beta superfamily hydrolase